jgi:hypothetical protein
VAETTYLLGAGINRCVRSPHGLIPPLARDFFRQALRHPRITAEYTITRLQPLFDFIQKYWHFSREDLMVVEFDLEDCFTFLELQRREADASGNEKELVSASKLEWTFVQLLLDVMSECEHWILTSGEFRAFAARVWSERAAVLTFNYDTLLESAVESASLSRIQDLAVLFSMNSNETMVTEDQIGYSPHEWNSYVAYGVSFDEVALRLPGNPQMVDGARYFRNERNKFADPRFLKLHGSLGWFYRSGYRVDRVKLEGNAGLKAGKSVLRPGLQRIGFPDIDYTDAEILLPLIITPVLNKPYDQHPVFRQVWAQARGELRQCRRLVIGGYSFPPTDFHVRRLLREVFSDGGPKELHIINPDSAVVQVAKELCNYRKPVTISGGIAEFLDNGI